jgi:hypothetical protein
MKTMFALNVAAYNTGIDPGNYCVKSINGKMCVEKDGSAITKEIKFKDGTCLEPNGTVIMTDGKKVTLKEGECVNETSVLNLSKHRDNKWNKPGKTQTIKPEKKKTENESTKGFEYEQGE